MLRDGIDSGLAMRRVCESTFPRKSQECKFVRCKCVRLCVVIAVIAEEETVGHDVLLNYEGQGLKGAKAVSV